MRRVLHTIRCQGKKAGANRSQYVKTSTDDFSALRTRYVTDPPPPCPSSCAVGWCCSTECKRSHQAREARQGDSKGVCIRMPLLEPLASAWRAPPLVVGLARSFIVCCPRSCRTRGVTPSDFNGVLWCPKYLQQSPDAIDWLTRCFFWLARPFFPRAVRHVQASERAYLPLHGGLHQARLDRVYRALDHAGALIERTTDASIGSPLFRLVVPIRYRLE